jgi:hypothetical protein
LKQYLAELAGQKTDFERRKRLEEEVLAKIKGRGFSAKGRLSRNEVHERPRKRV